MKKSLVLMAMAGVALAGCVNDVADDVQNQERVKISFDAPVVYNNATSRYLTNEIDGTTYPTEENFMVAAKFETPGFEWSTAQNFWDGFRKMEYDEDHAGWKDKSQDHYWPSGTLAFTAYSPFGFASLCTAVDYTTAGWQVQGFQVPEDQKTSKIDFLYSDLITGQRANSSNGSYYGVPINFKHGLSSIHFIIRKGDNVTADVRLKSIKILNAKDKGDFNGDTWTPSAGFVADYTAYTKGTDGNNTFETGTDYLTFSSSIEHVGENGGTSFILLPQDLEGVKLVVEYFVNQNYRITSPIELKGKVGTSVGVSNPVNEWEKGHKYIYFLNYSALAEDLIYFAPSVTDWVDTNITIPLD